MIRLLLVAISLFLAPCLSLATSPQSELLTQRVTELLPHEARWGVTVIDMKTGKEIISAGNTNELLSPASLVKLFTTGAALDLKLGKKPVSLTTGILHDGRVEEGTLNGSIYLRGNGNCLLSADDLKKMAQTLRGKGIQKVTGQIVADESRFDTRGLERSRKGAGHAPAGALGLDLHTVLVVVTPGDAGRQPVVSIEPPNDAVRFAVAARTVTGGTSSLAVVRNDDIGYRVTGNIPSGSGIQRWRFPLTSPARYTAQSFKTVLAEEGILVMGDISEGKTPENASLLSTVPGPDMKRFVKEMNMHSLNVAADNLLLAIVSNNDGSPSTRDKGVAVVKDHLARHGISSAEARIVDGSGLLPGNRVTPKAMARYLAAVSHQPWFRDLRDSLPRPGLDGTLRNGTYKNERFRAKSGSLENVVALAGYGVDKAGREIAFAFIVNTPGPLPPNARSAGDEVMRCLAE